MGPWGFIFATRISEILHPLTCSCEVDVVGEKDGGVVELESCRVNDCREHEENLGEVVELEAIAARCQGVRGVDELDVHVFACSRKDAKKVVNVFVEEATGDRELLGLRELRELAQKGNQNWLCHTWCTH